MFFLPYSYPVFVVVMMDSVQLKKPAALGEKINVHALLLVRSWFFAPSASVFVCSIELEERLGRFWKYIFVIALVVLRVELIKLFSTQIA